MRLVRFGAAGDETPGMLDAAGRVRSLAGVAGDIAGDTLSPGGLARLAGLDPETLPLAPAGVRLGPPVAGVGKIVGIGLNYADHAAEAGMALPSEPIFFLKAPSALAGPRDVLELPPDALKTDWEVELAFVIGTRAKNVSEGGALAHVAGYMVLNDISERAWQIERLGQWTKGKSHDGFAPAGPWLVTADAAGDPGNLALSLDVNGVPRQRGSTATMVFGIAEIVAYVSRFMTLHPGDIVTTGTPPGVGMGMKPPVFLKDGDVMRAEIAGLGVQETRVRVAEG
ncbi:MAG: 2-hydroxyhepta-2,4-diene-1,7-dioate isomerase [Alphaproteobacteria bacterium HGW-Alphaproteobacteria-2]|nr:MAG: 2-hydroxyhepta-2,4-diene-1,7-dioate isomerase [Alphaproteobacteria bacterium HGW-Alphaproteobacteria-2]